MIRTTVATAALLAGAALPAALAGSSHAGAVHDGRMEVSSAAGLRGANGQLHADQRVPALVTSVTGTRMSSRVDASLRNISESTNWSGYAGQANPDTVLGVQAAWTVPAVAPSTAQRFSSTWLGIDGDGNSDLIQTGTEQDSGPGGGYFAWWEILPAPASEITTASGGAAATVKPGDHMVSEIIQDATSTWTIVLKDTTRNWTFDKNVTYTGPHDSAEWIEEAPTVNGGQSALAAYGAANLSNIGIYLQPSGQTSPAWYNPGLTKANNGIDMVNQAGTRIISAVGAISSPTSSTPQSFSTYYVTRPSVPRSLATSVSTTAYNASWLVPSSYGHLPISHYNVKVFRNGVYWETLHPTTTHVSISKGLVKGDHYRCTVTATNTGGWTSLPTPESVAKTFLG